MNCSLYSLLGHSPPVHFLLLEARGGLGVTRKAAAYWYYSLQPYNLQLWSHKRRGVRLGHYVGRPQRGKSPTRGTRCSPCSRPRRCRGGAPQPGLGSGDLWTLLTAPTKSEITSQDLAGTNVSFVQPLPSVHVKPRLTGTHKRTDSSQTGLSYPMVFFRGKETWPLGCLWTQQTAHRRMKTPASKCPLLIAFLVSQGLLCTGKYLCFQVSCFHPVPHTRHCSRHTELGGTVYVPKSFSISFRPFNKRHNPSANLVSLIPTHAFCFSVIAPAGCEAACKQTYSNTYWATQDSRLPCQPGPESYTQIKPLPSQGLQAGMRPSRLRKGSAHM